MDLKSGFLSLENFRTALSSIETQAKLESLKGEDISKVIGFFSFLWEKNNSCRVISWNS